MPELFHPGEVVAGVDGNEWTLSCELDEAKPGEILVSVVEDGEFAGGLYLSPANAKHFARALTYYAERHDFWVGKEED